MKHVITVLLVTLCTSMSAVAANYLPEPPRFTAEADPEVILAVYPLGVISDQAAFTHHGSPQEKLTLANGKQGWLYTVGYGNRPKTYRMPSGEIRRVDAIDWTLGVRSYTLVLDNNGTVIDVVYKDDGTGIGVTAMELQHPRPQRSSQP